MTRRALEIFAIVGAVALGACGKARQAPGVALTQCTTCHGLPPTSGAHAAHVAFVRAQLPKQNGAEREDADKATCFQCHKTPNEVNDPDHIVGADGKPLPSPAQVRFDQPGATAPATQAGGTRAGAPQFLADGTCSNVYCHGATLAAGGTRTAPKWADGSVDGQCGSCHAIPPRDAPHTGLVAGDKTACARCHVGAIDASGVPVPNLHANGVVNVAADGGCNRCHGRTDLAEAVPSGDPRSAPPADTFGRSDSPAVGAHQAHLTKTTLRSAPIACADCHVVPAAVVAAGHIDGDVTVPFGALAKKAGAAPDYDFTARTCSNVYCHGAFPNGKGANAPNWGGDATAAACGSCHGLPPPSAAQGGPHPDSGSLSCGTCHPGYTFDPANPTAGGVNKALHINGLIDRN